MGYPQTKVSNAGYSAKEDMTISESDFQTIADVLYKNAGINLSKDKENLVLPRLSKRLRALNLSNFGEYCDLISSDAGATELKEMISSLTTNVTHFFRESHHFDHLKDTVLPDLIKKAQRGKPVRIWSAGCSNGQEPYSIAMTILNFCPDATRYDIKILGTDIDAKMIEHAKTGTYSEHITNAIPKEYSSRFLAKKDAQSGDMRQVNQAARSMVTFNELNLIAPSWPMKCKFDAIFCRNVAIYFDLPTQQKLWSQFIKYLYPESWLYIGHSERITGDATSELKAVGTTTYQFKNASGEAA